MSAGLDRSLAMAGRGPAPRVDIPALALDRRMNPEAGGQAGIRAGIQAGNQMNIQTAGIRTARTALEEGTVLALARTLRAAGESRIVLDGPSPARTPKGQVVGCTVLVLDLGLAGTAAAGRGKTGTRPDREAGAGAASARAGDSPVDRLLAGQ